MRVLTPIIKCYGFIKECIVYYETTGQIISFLPTIALGSSTPRCASFANHGALTTLL